MEKVETFRAKNLSSQSRLFLTPRARKSFTKLRQAFVKALILNYFDPKHHIIIEKDVSGYAIGEIFSQLTLDDLGQWYLVAFFSRKMIPAETWYETYDRELLTIVEAFKTWKYYLEGYKYEVLVFTDYNNLQRFMDTKNPSSRQVCWTQKLSRYHFQIDYQYSKTNWAANIFTWYPQRSFKEEKTLEAKNTKILHRLQSLLTWISGLNISGMSVSGLGEVPFLLHQVLIYRTTVLL